MKLSIKPISDARWDCVSLGEVMLRFDPNDESVSTTRTFRVWEGGGEYNVARALHRCFGLRTGIVTALVDNAVGRLIEDLMRQGGVALDHLQWTEFDGIGESARNGLYFLERGFGVRPAQAIYDRAHTAVSQLRPTDVDWQRIFTKEGARWFHTGGIQAGLSETATETARAGMSAAHESGARVSYDANYRSLLWRKRGGRNQARAVNRELAQYADVVFGSVDDFISCEQAVNEATVKRLFETLPNVKILAMTRRRVLSASRNEWGATLYQNDGEAHHATTRELDILDRVGGGDAFAAGVICGLLEDRGGQWAVECGGAAGALAMTTGGDSLNASRANVERLMRDGDASAVR